MNFLPLYRSHLFFMLQIIFVRIFNPPTLILPSLIFLSLLTSLSRIISYLNIFPLFLLYKQSSQRKSISNSPLLRHPGLLKLPLPWLVTDILPISDFHYQFFQNLALNYQTKEQVRRYCLFFRKFFRHNYQLIWDSKFQDAGTNIPSQFSEDELFFLPPLKIKILLFMNSVLSPSLILNSSLLILIVLTKVVIFPCKTIFYIPPSNAYLKYHFCCLIPNYPIYFQCVRKHTL